MPNCEQLKRRHRRACIGDLSERLFVENRAMGIPDFGAADASFAFTAHESATEVWALVNTVSGTTSFDEVVGLERNVTHYVVIRHLAGISSETWLRLSDGRRLDILEVADLDERGQFLEIRAAESGLNTQAASGL